jgi:hypothetical protein
MTCHSHQRSAPALHPSALATLGRRCAAALAGLALIELSLAAAPALAGSVTADSVMDRSGARQEAMSQVPKNATITRTQCQDIEIGLDNIRYRCTVFYSQSAPLRSTPEAAPVVPPSGSRPTPSGS